MKKDRLEKDFLGEKRLSSDAYYGIHTLRALENFNFSTARLKDYPHFIIALAQVKQAAARANLRLGILEERIGGAVIEATQRIINGEKQEQFVVDMVQGGAGTSTNMNMNEVVANLALEILGKEKGDYQVVHPNNQVNASQSTNDVYPTALKMAILQEIETLSQATQTLATAFRRKGTAFKKIIKMGRTQLQDAVPMSLGEEFKAFGVNLEEEINRLKDSKSLLREVNLGATAIGTRVNAPRGYDKIVVRELSAITGVKLRPAKHLIEATFDAGVFVQLSGVLKRLAVKSSKIANDLRLLSSGPRAGFNEINLPQLQAGSSIMPGKVNPVLPEVVNQVAFKVIGNDLTITLAAEAGQLQLNVMLPIITFSLMSSFNLLSKALLALREKCVEGLTANAKQCHQAVMNSLGLATFLNPLFGYETTSQLTKKALLQEKSLYDLVVKEEGLLSAKEWKRLFTVSNMMKPQFPDFFKNKT